MNKRKNLFVGLVVILSFLFVAQIKTFANDRLILNKNKNNEVLRIYPAKYVAKQPVYREVQPIRPPRETDREALRVYPNKYPAQPDYRSDEILSLDKDREALRISRRFGCIWECFINWIMLSP